MATSATAHDEFTAFAGPATPRLVRTAYLLCRDWHLAQDLVQITLAKVYGAWRRLAGSTQLEAYCRRVLVHTVIDHRRRRASGEIAVAQLPEASVPEVPADPDLRLTLLDALATLPELDRAIIVLRYWEDCSIELTARLVGVSPAAVKTRSRRALAVLRGRLAPR